MGPIPRIHFADTVDDHLDLANAASELCEVIPGQRGGGDLELLRSALAVVDALAQNTNG